MGFRQGGPRGEGPIANNTVTPRKPRLGLIIPYSAQVVNRENIKKEYCKWVLTRQNPRVIMYA